VPGVIISNSPAAPTIEWAQSFLPLETPVSLVPGDAVSITVTSNDGAVRRWQVETGARLDTGTTPSVPANKFDQSTFGGSPLSRASLSRPVSGHKPKLSRKGEAAQFLLSAFNGERTIEDLKKELLRRFNDTFPSPAAASMFLSRMTKFSDGT
jgi:hypothetical protein